MVPSLRRSFNAGFTAERYRAYADGLERRSGVPISFHLSETPCFLPLDLAASLVEASQQLLHQLLDQPRYRQAADAVVPPDFRLARGETRPTFVQVDFGLLDTPRGREGRLVELQAFPSLYGFQVTMAEAAVEAYGIAGVTPFLGGISHAAYVETMRRAIVGPHDPAQVVLVEIDPRHQKTYPDFVATEQLWGVRAVDVRALRREGRRLVYDRDGRPTPIARIYNRVIPDELHRTRPTLAFDFRDDLDVEWVGGPDWFFRISKFSLPWLEHPWVPRTHFLSDLERLPDDREHWLLKPLFSFAGGGIVFAPTDAQIAAIPDADRANYVLQERIDFTPTIETPHGPTKAEIRVMLVLEPSGAYRAVLPLVRMGRGKMMGVDFNKGLQWVGAAAGLMPAG